MPTIETVDWEITDNMRDDLRLAQEAMDIGFSVEARRSYLRIPGDALSFTKGVVHIWFCRLGWRAADLIDNRFCHHRTYETLHEALHAENH